MKKSFYATNTPFQLWLREEYDKDESYEIRFNKINNIADIIGKSPRGVICHLASKKLYVGKSYTTKLNEVPMTKMSIAELIDEEAAFQLSDTEIESLSKTNKRVLQLILRYIKEV